MVDVDLLSFLSLSLVDDRSFPLVEDDDFFFSLDDDDDDDVGGVVVRSPSDFRLLLSFSPEDGGLDDEEMEGRLLLFLLSGSLDYKLDDDFFFSRSLLDFFSAAASIDSSLVGCFSDDDAPLSSERFERVEPSS